MIYDGVRVETTRGSAQQGSGTKNSTSSKLHNITIMVSRLIRFVPIFSNTVARLSAKPALNQGVRNTSAFRRFGYRTFSTTTKASEKPATVTVNFIDRDGDTIPVKAKIGDTVQEVASDNDVELECACQGTLSCSTCHVILDAKELPKLNLEDPCDEELDMLDLAYGLTDTSRLGCQITVTKEFEGVHITIPKATRDIRDQ